MDSTRNKNSHNWEINHYNKNTHVTHSYTHVTHMLHTCTFEVLKPKSKKIQLTK